MKIFRGTRQAKKDLMVYLLLFGAAAFSIIFATIVYAALGSDLTVSMGGSVKKQLAGPYYYRNGYFYTTSSGTADADKVKNSSNSNVTTLSGMVNLMNNNTTGNATLYIQTPYRQTSAETVTATDKQVTFNLSQFNNSDYVFYAEDKDLKLNTSGSGKIKMTGNPSGGLTKSIFYGKLTGYYSTNNAYIELIGASEDSIEISGVTTTTDLITVATNDYYRFKLTNVKIVNNSVNGYAVRAAIGELSGSVKINSNGSGHNLFRPQHAYDGLRGSDLSSNSLIYVSTEQTPYFNSPVTVLTSASRSTIEPNVQIVSDVSGYVTSYNSSSDTTSIILRPKVGPGYYWVSENYFTDGYGTAVKRNGANITTVADMVDYAEDGANLEFAAVYEKSSGTENVICKNKTVIMDKHSSSNEAVCKIGYSGTTTFTMETQGTGKIVIDGVKRLYNGGGPMFLMSHSNSVTFKLIGATEDSIEIKNMKSGNGNVVVMRGNQTGEMSNVYVHDCESTSTTSNNEHAFGAISIHVGQMTATYCKFKNCSSQRCGGAVGVYNGGKFYGKYSSFTYCSGTVSGGALIAYGSSLISLSPMCTVNNNTCNGAGAICATGSNAKVEIHNSTISYNTATGTGGGAMNCNNGGQISCNGSTLNGNKSAGDGGAVELSGYGNFTGCSFDGNEATGNGGAIFVRENIQCYLDSLTCTNNKADWVGGGICLHNGSYGTLRNSSFTNCKVTSTSGIGGGIAKNNNSSVSISGCTYSGCSPNGYGTFSA